MKKFCNVCLLLIFAASTVFAQSDRPFRFGLTVSPNLSWYSPETRNYVSEGSRLGLSYGVIADFGLGTFYSFSTGLNFSTFGGKLSFDESKLQQITRIERTYQLRYLEIPLAVKLHTNEIGYFTYFGRFGFSPGINLKATGQDSFVAGNQYTEEVDIKGQTPLLRAAMIIGLGTEYSLGGRISLFGGLTYNNGFSNNLKGEVLGIRPSANASFVMLNLGVMF